MDLPIQEFVKRRAQYWLIMEDLAAAVIGPFPSFDAVTEHITFCKARGDGAAVLGVFDSVFDVETIIKDRLGRGYIRLTPEEDRKRPDYGNMTEAEFKTAIAQPKN